MEAQKPASAPADVILHAAPRTSRRSRDALRAPLLSAALRLAPLLPSAPSRLLATTVQQARERIFGWARTSKNFTPFKSLSNLKRKGLKGPSIVRYYPEPSPVAKSLVISRGFNEERIEKNILNRTMGRGPPKKGAGKRATRGKK